MADYIFHKEKDDICLEQCYLYFQPDVSQTSAISLNLANNFINTVYNEHIPQRCKKLNICSNRIKNDGIPARWQDTLEEIYLDNNYIHDTDGVGWPSSLRILTISSNPLTEFPGGLPRSLQIIVCDNTLLRTVNNLPESLDAASFNCSTIYRLPHTMPDSLRVFFATYNLLTNRGLPTLWGSSLKTISLDNNKLTKFPKGLPDTVEYISLNNNKITEIPEGLPKSLITLSLHRNKLQVILYGHRVRPIEVVILTDNQLTVGINTQQEGMKFRWANSIQEFDNWNVERYHIVADKIRKAWKRYMICRGIRRWSRVNSLRWDLLAAAMHPSRAGRFQNIDPSWSL